MEKGAVSEGVMVISLMFILLAAGLGSYQLTRPSGGPTTAPPPENSGGVVVKMTDAMRYVPATVEVGPGETVRWVNTGSMPHTVTAYEGQLPAGAAYFDSGGTATETDARAAPPGTWLLKNAGFAVTFTVPGNYTYFCVPHESSGMVGTVVVKGG